jgi:hypothetical protein
METTETGLLVETTEISLLLKTQGIMEEETTPINPIPPRWY